MMFNTLSIIIIINQVLSLKKIRSHYRNTKKSFQMFLNNDGDDYNIEVLKARFLLGMVDSLSSELIKSIHVELLSNNHDYDDIISTLPHQLTEELINDKSKITNVIPLEALNPSIIMENISYSLILVPTSSIADTSTKSIFPTLLNGIYNSTSPINQISVKSTSSTSDIAQNASNDNIIPKGIDAIVKIVLRYCVPPMVMQTVPHKLPQIILQWIHEHMM